ncbi:RNA methyltransferase, TrmH family [Formosa sp. Hel1_31_208]|uniref:TrmH family RNA methyltransferase n=1 Tax=Formosa sp. Hel1_31_208 TaxID=1798225 RepID=UPI00087BDB69|nr:RNA methyltransferase [Formosa sp. Hel1_31_208]SDR92160.1 RNA methyltransferase, TrmH family [Formosa sp. Hel1_31_208]
MLTKSHVKLITSLKQKKFRQEHQLFVVEGIKGIQEFLNSNFELYQLFSTEAVFNAEIILISEKELQKISFLKSPNTALAIFRIPAVVQKELNGLIVALDDVRDPGNLGTIIRLCDWFGIHNLLCSQSTVDCYNPKVVQATMGSLTRVHIQYVDLEGVLEDYQNEVYGTFMDGETIYSETLPSSCVIIMGNEANGISEPVKRLVTKKISIPRFGNLQATESLNVATATAIILSEFKRNSIEM